MLWNHCVGQVNVVSLQFSAEELYILLETELTQSFGTPFRTNPENTCNLKFFYSLNVKNILLLLTSLTLSLDQPSRKPGGQVLFRFWSSLHRWMMSLGRLLRESELVVGLFKVLANLGIGSGDCSSPTDSS